MKRAITLVIAVVVGLGVGYALALYLPIFDTVESKSSPTKKEREILYWVAPMDANFRRDKPGKSPMGMDLVPVYADDAPSEDDVVTIDPKIVQNLGVRSEAVVRGMLNRTIQTVGYVEYDENALHHIHTRVDGWVEKLSVKAEGDPIQEGQVLFELYSPTLVNAQQEYVMAKSASHDNLLSASRDRLLALGMTETEIGQLDETKEVHQRISVFAKSDGVVGMLGIREGIYVTPATHVMSIAELDKVWVLAEVLERQSGLVSVGQEVTFELDSMPGKSWQGEIEYIYPELDATTRSLKVRVSFDSQNEVLRPNMFAQVSISIPGTKRILHVPRSAVIRGGLSDRVVLDLGGGQFRSIPITVGMEAGDRIEVLKGLKRGNKVVTSGQFLIDSESNIEGALARFEDKDDE